MKSKQFRNLMESSSKVIYEKEKGHQEIKHKGKTCDEAHPDMDHEEWEMSQNEEVESLGEASPKIKKHKVKTKGGGTETVSRDDLEAAGDIYDRLRKKQNVKDYFDSYFGGELNENISDEDIMEAVNNLVELCDAVCESIGLDET